MKTTLRGSTLVLALAVASVGHAHVPGTGGSTPPHEAALSVAAGLSSIGYFPVKVGMATVGLLGGAIVGVLTGGDTRAAYGLWVPLAGGDYLVRPAHLDGTRALEFFGVRYDDEPSQYDSDGSVIYDALYQEPDAD